MKNNSKLAVILVLLGCVCAGCRLIKATKYFIKEETVFERETGIMKIRENKILIETMLSDSRSLDYMLDLGSSKSIVFLDSSNHDLIANKKPVFGYGKITSADGVTNKTTYYEFGDIKTDCYSLRNSFLLAVNRVNANQCDKIFGIWGSDLFRTTISGKDNKILLLNFQDSTLSILDTLPMLTDWISPVTEYIKKRSWFSFKMRIGEQDLFFILDTGFSGSILLSSDNYKKLAYGGGSKTKEDILYGYITHTLSGVGKDTARLIRSNVQISDGLTADSVRIMSLNNINFNLVGIDFIKRFNVLVDYQTFKVYLQPNPNYRNQKDNFFRVKGISPINTADKGFIVMTMMVNSPAEKAGLKVGDQIVSINQLKIDQGNPCEIEEIYKGFDGNRLDNEIVVKRGEEFLHFIM